MLILNAPAKINWFLMVLGLRDDGFHEIRSLIQKVTLYDRLTFKPSDTISIETDAQIPIEDNLIYRAALLLQSKCGTDTGAVIGLEKNIPMGAGLGGGSSDAAAALLGLNELWSLNLSTAELSELAAELGSDVPFFIYGPISFMSGRGETITPFNALKTMHILLVKPSFDISTAWAYKRLHHIRSAELLNAWENMLPLHDIDEFELTKKNEKVNNIEHFIRNIEIAHTGDISDDDFNDLEPVVIERFPVIAEIKERLREQGAGFALMSGSGSTVFGVFDSREKADEASRSFQDFWTATVETVIEADSGLQVYL